MPKKLTTDDFIQRSTYIHNNKYDYSLVEYENSRTKVKIICPIHGIFEQRAADHNHGRGCPKCIGRNKTTDDIIKEFEEVHGDRYDYSLVNYINAYTKVKIICPIHGIFEQTISGHLLYNCPKCSGKHKKNTDEFIIDSIKIHNNKYDYSLVKYINAYTKVKIICPIHGIFEQRADMHLHKKQGCPKCAGNIILTTDEFIKKANKIHNNGYDYSLVNYINSYTKIKIICPIHGIFYQKANTHLNSHGCPNCKKSKGELKIKQFLNDKNFIYKEQYRFNDCLNIKPLPFDFYLPEQNMLIEYDGEQHFRIVDHWGGEKSFKLIQKRDQLKNDYCKDNNIKLLRIKYTDFKKITKILNNVLILKNN